MKLGTVLAKTIKGLYDVLATYFLLLILQFAITALLFHMAADALAEHFGYPDIGLLWRQLALKFSIGPTALRILVFAPLHLVLLWLSRKPRKFIQPYFERAFDSIVHGFRRITRGSPRFQTGVELFYSLVVTALFIPFVIQPTLVPGLLGKDAWATRFANLLDGTASDAIADSVVGFYRRFYAEPVLAEGVSEEEFEGTTESGGVEIPTTVASGGGGQPVAGPRQAGRQPMMDRWNPYVEQVAAGDPKQYAYLKAFMWVESSGQQYAVSPTGCAGLMQFCSGTAQDAPFHNVFGVGQVYACGCNGRCTVDHSTQMDLESGDLDLIKSHADEFPCELTDARFDPAKSIEAAGLYIDRLRGSYDDNLYLMYIGYNSGPGVSNRVWKALDHDATADLTDIEPLLADAMSPYYGDGSQARAQGLLTSTLPRLGSAFDAHYAPPTPPAADPVPIPIEVPAAG